MINTRMNVRTVSPYPMTSLYVGDLHPDVSEAMLFEKFSQSGPVLSIRVCRDLVSRRSLGYAYINFQQSADAERAMDTMNFDVMKGQPIRMMWSQRDPGLRRSGRGNIFIKNLDKSIDNKDMFDTFSTFGSILSCKVATDTMGQSKGYGFVHFETEESANKAIEKVNGMLLSDKKLFVARFVPRKDREQELGEKSKRFTNVFVKNLPESMSEEGLKEMFEGFGDIQSYRLMLDEEGVTKCFGFVSFADYVSAEKAVEEFNEKEMEGKILFAGRAQKRYEREHELKRRFEEMKADRVSRFRGVNLYVKNLDDTFDDEQLRAEFSVFGTITSAKVMKEDGRSRGFGFVCFASPEQATKAIVEMNGQLVGLKPLYVGLAQSKPERIANLSSQHMDRMVNMSQMRIPPMAMRQHIYTPSNIYMPPMGPPPRFYAPPMNQPTRWMTQGQGQGHGQGQGYPRGMNMNVTQSHGYMPMAVQAMYRPPIRTTIPGTPTSLQSPGAGSPVMHMSHGIQPIQLGPVPRPSAPPRPTYKVMRDTQPPSIVKVEKPAVDLPTALPPLDPSVLASARPSDQKQMLGERLYPVIQRKYPAVAGKVTGMLLEMDNSEILHLLEDEELLGARLEEALSVLSIHHKTGVN